MDYSADIRSLRGLNLQKRYGAVTAVSVANVDLPAGSITVLIGPSGSGKSTLLRLLALIEEASEGQVLLDGRVFDARKGPGREKVWPTVSLVFPKLFLWPHLTLRKNIELPLRKASNQLDAKTSEALDHYLERLHLTDAIDRFPNQASDGQRQRAALIRALMLKPRYLLLDEITSWLDVEHIATVGSILRERRDDGTGILIATHLIGFAKRIADHVLFMRNGQVVSQGGPELFNDPGDDVLRQFLLAL